MRPGPLDARLLLTAGAAWVSAATVRSTLLAVEPLDRRVTIAGHLAGWLAAGSLAGAAGWGLRALWVRRRREAGTLPASESQIRTPRAVRRMLAVCALAGGAAAWSAALAVATASPAPLAGWADSRATATVAGVVSGPPRVVDAGPAWREPQVQIRVATSWIRARGTTMAVAVPVTLRLDVGATPAQGSVVEATGRLGPAPPGTDVAVALSADRWAVTGSPGWLDVSTQAMRSGLTDALRGVPPEPGSLVAGLAIGDDAAQPPELAGAMRDSGLAHLTAVSGGNIAILLGVVIGAARLARASLRTRTVASIAALGVFTVLVGPQPSVLRAVAMGLIATVAVLVGGRRGSLAVLGAGVLVLVVLAPWLSTSWGFALSALATTGIIVLAPILADLLAAGAWTGRLPTAVREAVALTAAAQLGTLPVLVAMGGAVGWVALPANLLAAPFVVPVTVLGLATAVLSTVLPTPAGWVAQVAAWPAAAIVAIAHAAAGAPAAGLPWPTGWFGVVALAGAVAAVAGALVGARRLGLRPPTRTTRAVLLAAGVAVVVVLVLLPPGRHGWPPAGWLVLACDVGQGDAVLLNAGPGTAVLVDAGPDPDTVDRCLADAGVTAVAAVVLTHFHADHVDGLAGVLRGRDVTSVLVTPVRDPASGAESVDATLAAAGLRAEAITAGDRRRVGAVSWKAIWPSRRVHSGSVANNASIVLVAEVDGRRVLLTGDIEDEVQSAIRPDLRGPAFDVVKVPHHGSADVDPGLVPAVAAPIALVSVGADNDYGHPAASTIEAWRRTGSLVVRTDESGDIAVLPIDGGLGVVTRR